MISRLARKIHWKHWGILAKYGVGSREIRAADKLVKNASLSEAVLAQLEAIWEAGLPPEDNTTAA